MKKVFAALLTIALLAISTVASSKPESYIPTDNPLSTFSPTALNVSCGEQNQLEAFIKESGEVPVLKGRSFSPATGSSPIIMTMDGSGNYTLYLVNTTRDAACIIDFGQWVNDTKEEKEERKIES